SLRLLPESRALRRRFATRPHTCPDLFQMLLPRLEHFHPHSSEHGRPKCSNESSEIWQSLPDLAPRFSLWIFPSRSPPRLFPDIRAGRYSAPHRLWHLYLPREGCFSGATPTDPCPVALRSYPSETRWPKLPPAHPGLSVACREADSCTPRWKLRGYHGYDTGRCRPSSLDC